MKQVLMVLAGLLIASSSFAQTFTLGNCAAAAQRAANGIAKINHSSSVQVSLIGNPGHVEKYTDADGYFEITTVTGRGEGQCTVSKVSFNPQP